MSTSTRLRILLPAAMALVGCYGSDDSGDHGGSVLVHVINGGNEEAVYSGAICQGAFRVEVPIRAERVSRDLPITIHGGDREEPLAAVHDLVAGDVILINGQSNASASHQFSAETDDAERSPFLRSFGTRDASAANTMADRRVCACGSRVGAPPAARKLCGVLRLPGGGSGLDGPGDRHARFAEF